MNQDVTNGPESEEVLRRRPSIEKTVLYLCGCLLFVLVLLVVLIAEGFSLIAVLGIAAFGFGAAFFAISLFKPESSYLELRPDGFTVRRPFYGSFSHSWNEVADFRVENRSPTPWVRFLRFDLSSSQTFEKRLKASITGTGDLSLNYGMRWKDLAELMNDWQRRYGQSPGLTQL